MSLRPHLLVVVRLGSNTLLDEHLAKSNSDFAPAPGDWLMVGDGDEAPLRARVTKRQGDRASVQIQLGAESAAVA